LVLHLAEISVRMAEQKGQIQGDSVARFSKLLSIKNYVIEIMT